MSLQDTGTRLLSIIRIHAWSSQVHPFPGLKPHSLILCSNAGQWQRVQLAVMTLILRETTETPQRAGSLGRDMQEVRGIPSIVNL